MSVVGFDLSTDACRVAVVPIDKILFQDVKNIEGTSWETLAAIAFDGKQRFIGKIATSRKNCFSQIMKIIGKSKEFPKSDPGLTPLVEKGPNDLLFVCLSDNNSELRFTSTHLLAMVISELKALAERELKVDAVDECCIGIPAYFSESQRIAVLQAADIAGFSQVSLIAATTATALGHRIIRKKGLNRDTMAKENIAIVDVGYDIMQVSIVCLKRQSLHVLSYANDPSIGERSFVDTLANHFKLTSMRGDGSMNEDCQKLKDHIKRKGKMMCGDKEISRAKFQSICAKILNRMKVLLDKAVTESGIGKQEINGVLVTGPGSEICGVIELLENFFPKQPKATGKHVLLAPDSVAKGCVIQCAIKSNAFQQRDDHLRFKSMKECLKDFKVTDKEPPVIKAKTIELQVAEATDGRFELTPQEMSDTRECERKMAVREKIRVKISDILKVKDYARQQEITELNDLNGQLDKDDLLEAYLNVTSVEKKIFARKYEHDHKCSMSTDLTKKINEYELLLSSSEPKYRTIKKTAKDSFKDECKNTRDWLKLKNERLSQLSKTDDPIFFIDDVNKKIEFLKESWDAAQKEREPDIEEIVYTVTNDNFAATIDDFRRRLLKGVPEKIIKGCFLLPYQTEVGGVPFKWFQLVLVGRNNEFTTLHIKHHNVYNMGFGNLEGQVYEMGPGHQNKEGRPHEIGAEDQDKAGQPHEMGPGQQDNKGQPHEMGPGQQDKEGQQPEVGMMPGQQDKEGQEPEKKPELVRPTITGAKFVGFHCDYISMLNPEKLKWSNEMLLKKIEEFKVGEGPWLDAIHILAYFGIHAHRESCSLCKPLHAVRRAIMCISVMLNECTRMDALKEAVKDGFLGRYLTQLLMEFIWHWKVMSCLLRRWEANKEETEVPEDLWEYIKVHHIDAVGDIMHLILNSISTGKETGTSSEGPLAQPPPSSGGNDGDKDRKGKKLDGPPSPSAPDCDGTNKEQPQPQPPVGLGQNLLQIFSVSLEDIKLADILGILVHEARCTHVIYSCDDKDYPYYSPLNQTIRWQRFLNLRGPSIAISSENGCILEVVPKEGNRYGASEDTLMHLDDGCYDKHRFKRKNYGDGTVNVSYAILTEAVEVNLEIELEVPPGGFASTVTSTVSGKLEVVQQNGTNIICVGPAKFDAVQQSVRNRAPDLGLIDLLHSMPKRLPLSPSVLAGKLGESITVQGTLHFEVPEQRAGNIWLPHCGGTASTISQVLEIPKTIGFIENVSTPWVRDRFSYRINMLLISRNV